MVQSKMEDKTFLSTEPMTQHEWLDRGSVHDHNNQTKYATVDSHTLEVIRGYTNILNHIERRYVATRQADNKQRDEIFSARPLMLLKRDRLWAWPCSFFSFGCNVSEMYQREATHAYLDYFGVFVSHLSWCTSFYLFIWNHHLVFVPKDMCMYSTAKRSCVRSMENGQSACMLLTLLHLKCIRKMTRKGQARKKAAKRYELLPTAQQGIIPVYCCDSACE